MHSLLGWKQLRIALSLLFFVLVGSLLVVQLREVDWGKVLGLMRDIPASRLLAVAGLALASHCTYSLYDLLGRRHLRHRIPPLRVMAIAFVSYVFNLNLGALVGGFAFRYRLYSRAGLKAGTTTQVIGMSLVTNWLGYLVLAGCLFIAGQLPLPSSWALGSGALRVLGLLLLAAALAYLLACAFAQRRSWTLRNMQLRLPGWPMALTQLVLSVSNWLLIAAMIYLLLDGQAAYWTVMSVLTISAIAGVVTHIPAGLGVIEAVFLALLGGALGKGELLAALLAYRGIYYLAPLALAAVLYGVLEATSGRGGTGRARTLHPQASA